ncbi:MAG: DUF3027 domain-containing protein [Cryobacterium sp.]|uniref:DUF3027 domain-containing protein n=1 Tax=unclassified Cryobacterium TaxID=2649013 RepID=UPI0018CBCE3A|nr:MULTISPECIES: DUF3027 domain-containing protein [unclassified Cryobacterium]MCY7404275.1 DUF3027 domain-containing protein [Cryobacterium sp.]MEC5155010.1 hypothetical protein [Cryobacterium sp. CAN_C3]
MPETTPQSTLQSTDATLLAAVGLARTALLEITTDDTIGEVIGHIDEGDLVVSLLFDCLMTGYPGWRWTVSLARVDQNSEPKVLETELTPGDDSLIAPEWVPWSDRLVDDDIAADADDDDSDDDDSDDDDSDDDDDESDDGSDDDESDDDDDDDSDDDAESVEDDAEDSLDALDGIDFDEALAAAELNPDETAEAEAKADHSAPQPPTRSRRARRP